MEENKEKRLVLYLNDPFLFDDQEIKEIDMEGLVDLTAADLCLLDQMMLAKGYTGTRMDASRQYAPGSTFKVVSRSSMSIASTHG